MDIAQAPFEFLLKQPQVKKVSVPSGTIISNLGDRCDNFIILQKGLVRVYRPAEDGRAITLYHIGAGESCILTASCILNSQVFPAIAEIEQDAEGLIVSTQQMLHWLKTEPQWQQFIFSLLSQRMADLISLVDALAFRRLDSRLAAWLLEKSATSQKISITHQIIAEELASSREVISRLLKEFERNQLIKLSRGKIEIIDPLKICKIK
ncbi:MAG: CRP/FNR family transcriptional regulator, anaerobic regulatory protein [Methyloprofundus sp.]|nr:MAG: CRP/FNR family transcriptional regulator, anaerobic regulatory protein [Methyloprofundus sp.]